RRDARHADPAPAAARGVGTRARARRPAPRPPYGENAGDCAISRRVTRRARHRLRAPRALPAGMELERSIGREVQRWTILHTRLRFFSPAPNSRPRIDYFAMSLDPCRRARL